MNMRVWFRTLAFASILGLVASAAYAQAPEPMIPESSVPAEVSKALRDRVTQFFGYHVGTVNRRAIDLVAEDTKDHYFSSGKVQFLEFKIDKAEFTKDLTKAMVWLTAKREWQIERESAIADTPIITTWKIEDGNWVWYLDVKSMWATAMGASDFAATQASQEKNIVNAELLRQNPDGTLNLPKDFASMEQLAAQKQAILQQAGLDKTEVTLIVGTPAEEKITFHNSYNGDVMLELGGVPSVPGLKVSIEKASLGPREDGVVRIVYNPPAQKEGEPETMTQAYRFQVTLQPFNRVFPVALTIRAK